MSPYDEKEERGYMRRMTITLGLTLLLIIGLIVALSITIAVPTAFSAARQRPTGGKKRNSRTAGRQSNTSAEPI